MRSKKGFTLVELLAVIVIMGILMMIAIPAVSRIIENVRKDSFVNTARSYANAAKTLWTADSLTCEGTNATAVDDGDYYILINTKDSARSSLPELIGQGGRSSWGNKDVNGYVRAHVETVIDSNGEPQRKTTFYVGLSDGVHAVIDDDTILADDLKRGNVKVDISNADKKKVELTLDNGSLDCSAATLGNSRIYKCTNVEPTKNITGLCVDDTSSANVEGTLEFKPKSFAEDDWTTIGAAVKSGTYNGIYNVGDTKEADLGSLGKYTLRIANISTPAECSQADFSQTACGFVVEFMDSLASRNMHPNGNYKGISYQYGWSKDGWPLTGVRAYLSNNVYKNLPTDLQNIIIDTKVISGHGSSDTDNFISIDKLYLLSTAEVWKDGISTDTGTNVTRQLDYYLAQGVTFSNSSAAIKKRASRAFSWWLRTAHSDSDHHFYIVTTSGTCYGTYPVSSYNVTPAFRIG